VLLKGEGGGWELARSVISSCDLEGPKGAGKLLFDVLVVQMPELGHRFA